MLDKEKVAYWYQQGLWSASMVQDAVDKGVLTEDEATEILGEEAKTWAS